MGVKDMQHATKIYVAMAAALVVLCAGYLWLGAGATMVPADEVHYSYGDSADSVVFNWRGEEQMLYYGVDTSYGSQAAAGTSAVTPVDVAGPFREVKLTGLLPGTKYHYKIGADGVDRTFSTVPTAAFSWVDIGGTGASGCKPWQSRMQALIAAQRPHFVTHGGGISSAHECGKASVHQYYLDQEVWSHDAAFQPVWGDDEYEKPSTAAPAGTPRDTLANYKGRSYITNARIVPSDTAAQTSHPGCGSEISATANTCQGEDWGWFTTGKVLFISYPEPWPGAIADWQTKAGQLMAAAQADANVDFIVTYGHRPPYSSVMKGANTEVQSALDALAKAYSPGTTKPEGKYILNVAHHLHGEEVFRPINGLTHITNGGGTGQVSYDAVGPNSIFRTVHPAIMLGTYNASVRTLTVKILCGPDYAPNPKEVCTYGSTLYTKTFQAGGTRLP